MAGGNDFPGAERWVNESTNIGGFLQISYDNLFSSQVGEPQGYSSNATKKTKSIIGAFFVVLVIVMLALIPKGLLIYFVWRKSRNQKQADHAEAAIAVHPEPKLDLYFEEMRELAIKNDPLFLKRFTEVYPDFTRRLLHKHPQLSKSELSLCAMIFLNFSSKEIAEYTFIQHRSVQTNRSRLRKKMRLSSHTDLYRYIKSFA
jgi:DNA-binding CsgD family transcriptional regulator